VLFYFPGDSNWWLGTHNGNDLVWDNLGATTGFGNIADGRPVFTGNFTGGAADEVLAYFPGDGDWWLSHYASIADSELVWDGVGNTGRPHASRVRLHIKLAVQPTAFTLDQMVQGMVEVYRSVGILVEVGSVEHLRLADVDIDVGRCESGQTTPEQRALFDNRRYATDEDICVYVVRTVTSRGNALNGCAAHDRRQSCVVARAASRWTLAHEVGHVLDLDHVNDTNRLMTGGGTNLITNPPPDLVESERRTMERSQLTHTCP
jgi:hypothetical protein